MRSHIKRIIFFAIVPIAILITACEKPGHKMDPARLSRIDAVMQEYVDQEKLAGSVVYVARNGEVAYHKSFGWRDREAQAPMQNDAIFRIASQSKALTSVAIMILQEQGKLLINDPLAKYLPEFAETTVAVQDGEGSFYVVPAKRQITLRDLLTHTAGIDYGMGPGAEAWKAAGIQGWYFADRDEPVRETIRRMAALPNAMQPGEAFVYGYNTDILGVVVEVVSGETLNDFITNNILKPLNMNDTYFYLPEEKKDRIAKVYSSFDGKSVAAPNPGELIGAAHIGQGHYLNGPRKSYSGGAGLLSTAKDYGMFLQMLLNGGELNGVRILSPKTVELMTENHIGHIPDFRTGRKFGLGFQIITDLGAYGEPGSEGNYGWGGAYHSTYWVDPKEKMVMVYLTQLIPARNMDDAEKLNAMIYQAIVD